MASSSTGTTTATVATTGQRPAPAAPLPPPPKKARRQRGETVNALTQQQLDRIVRQRLLRTNQVARSPRGPYVSATVVASRRVDGSEKYPVVSLSQRFTGRAGQTTFLVHLLWFRWQHDGALIRDDMTISHRDKSTRCLKLVEESRDMNESRKYCHLFGWYAPLRGETVARCPHKENPCSGPLDAALHEPSLFVHADRPEDVDACYNAAYLSELRGGDDGSESE